MTYNELNQLTVLQLRKLAKENSVVLGSGIDKAGIIDKLLPVLSDDTETETPVHEDSPLAEPKYQAAWHNSDTPKYSAKLNSVITEAAIYGLPPPSSMLLMP